jgi:SAM-dependent methyltransferase
MLSSIHRFVLQQCSLLATKPDRHVLDYGCGAGETVETGVRDGLDIYGVEVFYEGGNTRELVRAKGLLGSRVRELVDGRIPFADASFDVVVSNQVFEHVEDMEPALDEICRVLAPHGTFLCLFPSRDVIREGHCGIPLVHWFPRGSRIRYPYMLALRSVGLGFFKNGKSRRQWSHDFLRWLDDFTFYRSHAEIFDSFRGHFEDVIGIEDDYVSYRLGDHRFFFLAKISRRIPFNRLSRWFCRKFAGLVLVARRPMSSRVGNANARVADGKHDDPQRAG